MTRSADVKRMECLVCGKPVVADEEDEPRICEDCWRCPECGCSHDSDDEEGMEWHEGFIIESEDNVVCHKCDNSWTYRGIEAAILAKSNRTVCPHCKGTGVLELPAKQDKKAKKAPSKSGKGR